MLEKAEEMENDPTAPKNTIESPTDADELETDEVELEDYADADIISDDDTFDLNSTPFVAPELSAINRQLDQLQSVLDEIENRNAGIHKELLEILHSNREVRQEIKEEINNQQNSSSVENEADSPASKSNSTTTADGGSKASQDLTSQTDGLMSSTTAVAHMLNVVTQDIDKLTT